LARIYVERIFQFFSLEGVYLYAISLNLAYISPASIFFNLSIFPFQVFEFAKWSLDLNPINCLKTLQIVVDKKRAKPILSIGIKFRKVSYLVFLASFKQCGCFKQYQQKTWI